MLANANFLCEIGTEEIPAGYIPPAIESAENIIRKSFTDERIDFDEIKVYATPRRIAIAVSNLVDSQRSETIELKGPSKKAAYDQDGNPSKALGGFLKGNSLTIDDVVVKDTEKGEYVFATKSLSSEKTETIIPSIIENLINTLPFPKKMKWSDKSLAFPRPIRYFMLLFNDKVVDFEMEGILSSNLTRGHFIQNNSMIEVNKISSYEEILSENGIILDQDKRKEIILADLRKTAEAAGGFLNEDEELLSTVTYIVEKPNIILCEFNESFLEVPDIVLIAEMKEHQKYFAVVDSEGKLLNKFLVTSNNPLNENIQKGNVKVISARFSDAEFFYKEDAKKKLSERVDSLKKVLFHKELGSIFDKVTRMQVIGSALSSEIKLDSAISEKIQRALLLCKTDLDTAMVNEFASLQGQIGTIYAINEGEDIEVAQAINNHYKPRYHGDEIPKDIVSVVSSLCEKIDNIFGSFSVGNIPKGSQDPYALRRQAHAIIELIIENNINIELGNLFSKISSQYKDGAELINKIIDFIEGRVKTILSDRGYKHDVIDACMIKGNTDYLELLKKAESLHEFRKNESFSQLLLAFKRMNNIVSSFRKKNKDYELKSDVSLLEVSEEKELHRFFDEKNDEIGKLISESNYISLFELMIAAKTIIDNFFDNVMVMDERVEVRDNRLHLLESINNKFRSLIDFSKISDK